MRSGAVVLDTNILVSATYWRGVSYLLLKYLKTAGVAVVLSPDIVAEYYDSLEELSGKVQVKALLIDPLIQEMMSVAEIVTPNVISRWVIEDPHDDHVIAAAVAAGVEYLITQDRHLLKLDVCQEVRIVTPEEFLKTMGAVY